MDYPIYTQPPNSLTNWLMDIGFWSFEDNLRSKGVNTLADLVQEKLDGKSAGPVQEFVDQLHPQQANYFIQRHKLVQQQIDFIRDPDTQKLIREISIYVKVSHELNNQDLEDEFQDLFGEYDHFNEIRRQEQIGDLDRARQIKTHLLEDIQKLLVPPIPLRDITREKQNEADQRVRTLMNQRNIQNNDRVHC